MDAIARAKLLTSRAKELIETNILGRDRLCAQREDLRKAALESRTLRTASPHDLMPLDLAVFQIFRRVYQDRLHVAAPGRSTAHLDGLAYVIAEYTPIYTYAPHGGSARALTKAELAGGLFQDGAKALIYIDGRPTVEHLAVSAKTVPAVTVTLIAASNVRDPHG